jgi:UDP-N-acetyl-D-glucosamine dehydrogenase
MQQLLKKGTIVTYNHPSTPELAQHSLQLKTSSTSLTPEFLAEQDAVLIITDHSASDQGWIVSHTTLIIDTRNVTRHVTEGRAKIVL